MTSVGIWSVGTYLPPIVRGNDWWPAEVVEGWMAARGAAPPPEGAALASEGARLVAAAMAGQGKEPFQGWRERHVMPQSMTSLDMETLAAEEAITRAAVPRSEIDAIFTQTMVPDVLFGNTACELHARLGLHRRCLSTQIDGAAFSFLTQLTLAEQLIAAGRARYVLIVQSCAVTRLLDRGDPISPFFGDGASAAIVGPVTSGRGILGFVQRTDGRFPRTLVASVRGGRWYDEGHVVLHTAAPDQVRQMLLEILDHGRDVIDDVLRAGERCAGDVDVFISHQGMPWLRRAVQEHAGLAGARSVETFSWAGNLFAVNLPLGLATAEREGALGDGDLVLTFGGGTGQTVGAALMRWGR